MTLYIPEIHMLSRPYVGILDELTLYMTKNHASTPVHRILEDFTL